MAPPGPNTQSCLGCFVSLLLFYGATKETRGLFRHSANLSSCPSFRAHGRSGLPRPPVEPHDSLCPPGCKAEVTGVPSSLRTTPQGPFPCGTATGNIQAQRPRQAQLHSDQGWTRSTSRRHVFVTLKPLKHRDCLSRQRRSVFLADTREPQNTQRAGAWAAEPQKSHIQGPTWVIRASGGSNTGYAIQVFRRQQHGQVEKEEGTKPGTSQLQECGESLSAITGYSSGCPPSSAKHLETQPTAPGGKAGTAPVSPGEVTATAWRQQEDTRVTRTHMAPTRSPGIRCPSIRCQLRPTTQSGGRKGEATATGMLRGSPQNPNHKDVGRQERGLRSEHLWTPE